MAFFLQTEREHVGERGSSSMLISNVIKCQTVVIAAKDRVKSQHLVAALCRERCSDCVILPSPETQQINSLLRALL